MAQAKMNKRVVGIRASSWANFNGVFWSIIGLGVAILHSLRETVSFTQDTQSLLSGLVFGTAVGIVSIIVVPFVYYAIGYVLGLLQAFVFNVVAESSKGVVLHVEDEK
jgi:hypothetical protein